jgi:hypothetical protein
MQFNMQYRMQGYTSALWRGVMAASLCGVMGMAAKAQMPATSHADSVAYAAAHAIADTGRMIVAYKDFSRYTSPYMCLASLTGMMHRQWRRHEQDTVEQYSPGDTLPTEAMVKGRACIAKLDLRTMTPPELYAAMKMYVLLKDSAMVDALVARRMAQASTTEAKGQVMKEAIGLLWRARPTQREHAVAMMRQLDALGHDARIARLQAAADLYEMSLFWFDTTGMQHYRAEVKTIRAELTPAERQDYSETLTGWNAPMTLAWLRADPQLPSVVHADFQAFQGVLAKFHNGQPLPPGVEQMVTAFAQRVGQPADSVSGKFWFNAGNTSHRPTPGRVNLVMQVDKSNGTMTNELAMIRRIAKKYAADVDVTLVVKTKGYSWSSPPQTPEAEAKTDAWYFLKYMKLPVTLVVDETPFTRDDTGRRQDGQIDFEKHYMLRWGLIGRDGRLRTMSTGKDSEAMLEAFVRSALGR